MRLRRAALLVSAFLAGASPAAADGLALKVEGGYFAMTNAKSSAQAVFDGSSGGKTFGGEVAYTFGNGLYVAGGARYFKKDGSRVFVQSKTGPVFKLRDEPLSIRIVPAYGTLGFRFRRHGGLVPYVGLGIGMASYHEESTVGGLTQTTSETKVSGQAVAGVEMGRRSLRFGAEAAYSLVPSAIGAGGVSKIYEETDVGGFSLVGKIIFARAGH